MIRADNQSTRQDKTSTNKRVQMSSFVFFKEMKSSDISMMHISGCLMRDQIIREKYHVLVMLAKAQNIENIDGVISQRLEAGFPSSK